MPHARTECARRQQDFVPLFEALSTGHGCVGSGGERRGVEGSGGMRGSGRRGEGDGRGD